MNKVRYFILLSAMLVVLDGCKRNKFEFECMEIPVLQSGDLYVANAVLLKEGAGRAEFSPDGTKISYHARGNDNYYDCYLMNTDGSGAACLTCDNSGFPGRHAGQPSWHPGGDYLTFQAEKESYYTDRNHALAHPGVGFNNDIYIMKSDGSQVWQITNLDTKQKVGDKTPFTGVLHPHFSNDGETISWSQKIDKGGEWGVWEIVVGDFAVVGGEPLVTNLRTFQPGDQHLYYETNDFNADDSKMTISANLKADQREVGMDLYEMDVITGEINALTDSFDNWDESGHYSPDQQWIAYLGSSGYTSKKGKKWYKWGKAEFWLMKTDGSRNYPITAYNCPDSDDFVNNRVMPAYVSWRADGMALLVGILVEEDDGTLRDELWRLELAVY